MDRGSIAAINNHNNNMMQALKNDYHNKRLKLLGRIYNCMCVGGLSLIIKKSCSVHSDKSQTTIHLTLKGHGWL